MLPIKKRDQPYLFFVPNTQFLIVFVILSTLLFASASFLYADDIYVFLLRKFYAPKIEKEFGFRKGESTFKYNDQEYKYFVIEYVEPNGVLVKAGFKAGDAPIDWACKFGRISQTQEASFYKTLMNAEKGELLKFSVLDLSEFTKTQNKDDNPFYFERKVEFVFESSS